MAHRTIVLKQASNVPVLERVVASAQTIKPGMRVLLGTNDQFYPHNIAGQGGLPIFAFENELEGKDIDTDYAAGSRCYAKILRSGDEVYTLLPANAAAVAIGDFLESNGDGAFRKATFSGVAASLAVAGQADANGVVTYTATKPGSWGNAIKIIQADAGSASVAVAGFVITVTPGSGANTATAVAAQVAANAGAASLVTATAGGTGATEPGIQAGALLTGGLNFEPLLMALEAVDNSAGGSAVRIRAMVL